MNCLIDSLIQMVVGQFTRRAAEKYAARCVHDVPLDKVMEMLEQWWDVNGGGSEEEEEEEGEDEESDEQDYSD
jgi:hypothetical protein